MAGHLLTGKSNTLHSHDTILYNECLFSPSATSPTFEGHGQPSPSPPLYPWLVDWISLIIIYNSPLPVCIEARFNYNAHAGSQACHIISKLCHFLHKKTISFCRNIQVKIAFKGVFVTAVQMP